jgi:hypothetical protein
MSDEINEPTRSRAYREYVWFAMTLVALMICTAIQETGQLASNASFATSDATASR